MTLSIKREPFNDFGSIAKTIQDLNRTFSGSLPRFFNEEGFVKGNWNPSVDIYQDQNGIVLQADLPGIKAGDFDLSIENNVLTLKGERKFEKKSDEGNYHRVERSASGSPSAWSLRTT